VSVLRRTSESEEPEETVDYEQETIVFRPVDFTEKSQSAEPPKSRDRL
jgi:hypothetical protein